VWPFYGRRALSTWVDRTTAAWSDVDDVFVYFNNDPNCAAVDNARTFARIAAARGHAASRVPARAPENLPGAADPIPWPENFLGPAPRTNPANQA
jgi:hypothetical protein